MRRAREKLRASLETAFQEEFDGEINTIRRDWQAFVSGQSSGPEPLLTARQRLHSLKGTTRLLGLSEIPEEIHELEEMILQTAKAGAPTADFLQRLDQLTSRVYAILSADTKIELPTLSSQIEVSEASWMGYREAFDFLLTVDELSSVRAQLEREIDSFSALSAAEELVRNRCQELVLRLQNRIEKAANQARALSLLPASEVFLGLQELAEEAAAEQGKSVSVRFQVEQERVSRELVLSLRASMVHLTQNAISHGISESSGVIEFTFRRSAGNLLFSITDDGSGLSLDDLREAVVAQNLISLTDWENSTEEEQLNWIFQPGISTREQADQLSGRGLGLNIVRQSVERLGGSVEVDISKPGTTFRLLVPQQWNIRRTLRITCGDNPYLVLLDGLRSVVAYPLDPNAEKPPPSLEQFLGFPKGPTSNSCRYGLVIEESPGHLREVGIDSIAEMGEGLVLPVEGFTYLHPAIVGSGSVGAQAVPVISLMALQKHPPPPLEHAESPSEVPRPATVLVVDDSPTTRSLVLSILSSHGFKVEVAANGLEALELLKLGRIDLIVSDYQMPQMDGLAFLQEVRTRPKSAELPFILLTSVNDVSTFERASLLGADRCLGKQNFSESALLELIEVLLR